jgi:hypothetical protein
VASPGRDTCQVDLAFSAYDWTSTEVTRVTTHRVTRGTLTSADDVAICLFLLNFFHFWGILGIFGGQILGGSWGCETNSIPI